RCPALGKRPGDRDKVIATWEILRIGVDPSPVFEAKVRDLGAGLPTLTFGEAGARVPSESRLRLCLPLVSGENGLSNQRRFGLRAPFVDAGPRGLDRPVLRGGGARRPGEVARQPGPTAFGQNRGALCQLVSPARKGR